jgi:hypothetical protein
MDAVKGEAEVRTSARRQSSAGADIILDDGTSVVFLTSSSNCVTI